MHDRGFYGEGEIIVATGLVSRRGTGRTEDLKAAQTGSVAGSAASAGLEESHWLCPIEDRRRLDSAREGMIEGFSLGNYLLLVDHSARLFREGKWL